MAAIRGSLRTMSNGFPHSEGAGYEDPTLGKCGYGVACGWPGGGVYSRVVEILRF
jgi:hypothetical protein